SSESAIIRRHRRATPYDLSCDYVSAAGTQKRIGQIKNTECEVFRPLFHFVFVHGGNRKLKFENRKSLLDHVDVALHVEILLGHIVVFAVENFLETADCFRNRNILTLIAGENLCHVEGLAKEPLNLACALNSDLVLRA